jgi:hypothetical protein
MSEPTFVYRHAVNPSRGLAATGVLFVKWVLALPHLIVAGALSYLGMILAYIGYFVVAFTGEMPTGIFRLMEISFKWSARTYGWLIGYTDDYPPFETDPQYPVDVKLERPIHPSKGWAVAGIFFIKAIALLPHFIALAFVGLAAALATWFGYWAVVFTGRLPVGIQDFVAGTAQWYVRVYAFLGGITDEYPRFSLEATPSA